LNAVILTYHSHHLLGPGYAVNDHAALPLDLELVTRAGYRIVSLDRIVDGLAESSRAAAHAGSDDVRCCVALTFDDGPVFDVDDFVHPELGFQRGFVGAMRDFSLTALGRRQPGLTATSFVIASPSARKVMEATFDRRYTYLEPGALDDAWWERGIATGLLSIANHSWDHLHPALPKTAHSGDARADFTRVVSDADADAQIRAAAAYLQQRTHGRAAPHFAYPFGHCNAFLATDYLPRCGADVGVRAAFTTEPRPVGADDSRFRLPRYVCGEHWKSPGELAAILAEAAR
jgi:peptidoglycan/xylan/chitin deacetylase (PgdA/CDA1 family)